MIDLTISLDVGRKEPMYEQIYSFIRSEMEAGRIRAGEKLPSSRSLASSLGVSRSTADQAYDQLLAEGYLVSMPRKGYFACEMDRLYEMPKRREPDAFSPEPKRVNENWLYDFAPGGIAADSFPHRIWNRIARQVLSQDDGSLFAAGDAQGEWGLRSALAEYLHHARGVLCGPEQIIIGAGNDFLLLLLHLILGENSRIAMDDPTYGSAYLDFRSAGDEICLLEPDDYGMRADLLEESGASLAYVMPSHQFPLGTVMPISRRQRLLSWAARKEGRYLIEDDYDSEFRYRGKPIPALQGYDASGRVIYLGTFSQSLAPAIRISYMVLPESLLARYKTRASHFSVTVSRVDQKIVEHFLREGYFERHLNRMRGVYRERHDCLVEMLKMLGGRYTVRGGNTGVHLTLSLPPTLSEQEAVSRAARVGVRVYGISGYCVDPAHAGTVPTVLLGYGALAPDKIAKAVELLKKAWAI